MSLLSTVIINNPPFDSRLGDNNSLSIRSVADLGEILAQTERKIKQSRICITGVDIKYS